jgi:hypothetical protein
MKTKVREFWARTRVKAASERQKLKVMRFGEKAEYIWMYYKLHIILGAVILFLMGTMFNGLVLNAPKRAVLAVVWMDDPFWAQHTTELNDILVLALGGDPEKQRIDFEYFQFSGVAELDMNPRFLLASMVMAQKVDVMVASKSRMEEYVNGNFYADISAVLETVNIPLPAGALFAARDDGTVYPYAVPLAGGRFAAVIVNTKRPAATVC